MGDHTFPVSMKLFANNRKRLCDALKKAKNLPENSVVLLQGGEQAQQYCTDADVVFRQVLHGIGAVSIAFITLLLTDPY